MTVVRIVESGDLAKIEGANPLSAGTPGNPHRERYELQESGDLTWLVAWIVDRPCGSVTVVWPDSGELSERARPLGCAEIEALGVHEDARGQGIGRALMEAAEVLARERKVELVGLEVTVANPNQDVARELYSRMGYEDAGLGEFISGYTYWADGKSHRDEELHRYLTKRL